jgi:hypothetical protein
VLPERFRCPLSVNRDRVEPAASPAMSVMPRCLGQFQKSTRANAMSAFLPLATRQRISLEVRFVPFSEVGTYLPDVGFTPRNGHQLVERPFPKGANSGNGDVYSITSSARASNVGGMANRQAFAVLRFTTNSNRAGRSIGISVGRAPLNILST